MIRRCQLNISYANIGKRNTLDSIFKESKSVINKYISELWKDENFSSKYVDFKVDTWLSARMQQCLGKQALEIVKSQRKKKRKTKPTYNGASLNLDSRFIDLQQDTNTFDMWLRLTSIGNKMKINLPSKKHKHFHKYFQKDWQMKKSVRLRKNKSGYFFDVYFEKETPVLKTTGKSVGMDCGYKKLLVSSENVAYDVGLEGVYEKLARKKQGSKSFKKSLIERDNKINQSINQILFSSIKTLVVEDLKDVKKNTNGKIHKKFNNKLQRWSYAKVLSRLSLLSEEQGINFIKVNPAYTSQTCSNCGFRHKDNRKHSVFKCLDCGMEKDADYNASLNILQKGAYSPSPTKKLISYSTGN